MLECFETNVKLILDNYIFKIDLLFFYLEGRNRESRKSSIQQITLQTVATVMGGLGVLRRQDSIQVSCLGEPSLLPLSMCISRKQDGK